MKDEELKQLLQAGIAAARAGDKEQARDLLLQVIDYDEKVEAAWLWLSGVMDDLEERQICLENVLAINPANTAALAGLRHLVALASSPSAQASVPAQPASEPPRPVLTPILAQPVPAMPQPAQLEPEPHEHVGDPAPPARRPGTTIEIDPFGCPYCGGSVSGDEPRCDHCRRLVTVRSRKRAAGVSLVWPVLAFALLGIAAWGEGYFAQLVEIGQLPEWLTQTAVRFLVGSALFSATGLPGELVQFANTFVLINTLLAGLCILTALGLAFRFRAVYWWAFLLLGFLVVGTGAGLLAQLVGWVPALFRLGLVALATKWLVENAPAFEWETHYYNADVDSDLRNGLDYYSRGLRYRDMGMWAKAAAHWKVAAQLEAGETQYRVALATAYARMGYPAAALSEVDRVLARDPDDLELHTFRDSLASLALEGPD
jgi:tetratricopeptide (TPR) repeat protein